LPMSYKLRILSLGAGVQSTTILLMSHHGELPKLDAAIFSDTGWEREATYLWLDYLRSIVSIPIITVSGGNVREDMREAQVRGLKKDGVRWANMPFYTRDRSTGNLGMLRRQCTREYKIEPIRKELRLMLGLVPRQRAPQGAVEQWVGISVDEAHRVWARSPDRMSTIRYPLIDMTTMTRNDCLRWLERKGYPIPPKSACIGCPFHSNREWSDLNEAEFLDAVDFDEMIRNKGGMKGDIFIHRSCVPLAEVDLRNGDEKLGQQCFDFVKDEKLNLFVRNLDL